MVGRPLDAEGDKGDVDVNLFANETFADAVVELNEELRSDFAQGEGNTFEHVTEFERLFS